MHRQLGDHALVAAFARCAVRGLAVLHAVRGVAQWIVESERIAQQSLTPDQR